MLRPKHLDLKKDRGLTVQWEDGSTSYYSVPYLRKMSPAADNRKMREEMESNPLAVLPASVAQTLDQPLKAVEVQFVGNYAIRIVFSDGHNSGIYSWDYLLSLDKERQDPLAEKP